MSILKVDTVNEKTSGNGVHIPGHVIQVVSSIHNTGVGTSSSSYGDISGLSLNITPKSTANKILVDVKLNNISTATGNTAQLRLVRGSTVLAAHSGSGVSHNFGAFASGGGGGNNGASYVGADSRKINSGGVNFLDTPATTSAVTYKVQIASSNNGDAVYLNRWALNTDLGAVSSITLMEIAQLVAY
jgi:hypothetical protein